MAKGWSAYLKTAVPQVKKNIRYILNEAVQDVIEGAQTPQRGIGAGATSFEVGKIPVVTGTLINSLHMGTQQVGRGEIGTIEPGTIQTFEWQTPYAAAVEFGHRTKNGREVPGRFFVTANAKRFSEYVDKHAKEVGG